MIKVGNYFSLGAIIGKGSFGKVYLGMDKKTQSNVAIKELDLDLLTKQNPKLKLHLQNEISIMKEMQHKNIVCLLDCKSVRNIVYLVLEYCGLGDLQSYLNKQPNRKISEEKTLYFMKQFAEGLKLLRKNDVIHRDLKPENLLLCDGPTNDEPILKIADFGFARHIESNKLAQTLCGSPLHMAPEILANQSYSVKSDLWSVGTIMYQMLFGVPIFQCNNFAQLFQAAKYQPIIIPSTISPIAHDLLTSLLQRDPNRRISWEEFFDHPYFSSVVPLPAPILSIPLPSPALLPLMQQRQAVNDAFPLLQNRILNPQPNSVNNNNNNNNNIPHPHPVLNNYNAPPHNMFNYNSNNNNNNNMNNPVPYVHHQNNYNNINANNININNNNMNTVNNYPSNYKNEKEIAIPMDSIHSLPNNSCQLEINTTPINHINPIHSINNKPPQICEEKINRNYFPANPSSPPSVPSPSQPQHVIQPQVNHVIPNCDKKNDYINQVLNEFVMVQRYSEIDEIMQQIEEVKDNLLQCKSLQILAQEFLDSNDPGISLSLYYKSLHILQYSWKIMTDIVHFVDKTDPLISFLDQAISATKSLYKVLLESTENLTKRNVFPFGIIEKVIYDSSVRYAIRGFKEETQNKDFGLSLECYKFSLSLMKILKFAPGATDTIVELVKSLQSRVNYLMIDSQKL